MSTLYDVTGADGRSDGLRHAGDALRRGELVVLPTDTVYGIAADAFSPEAVARLLAAKGRGRSMPPPVLVGDPRTLDALADGVPASARALVERFWPGPLTVILAAQPSLTWDLGETRGTVAVRMPADAVAVELLQATGPLAVSSANLTGRTAAATAAEAREQLGDAVACYLDDGRAAGQVPAAPSTIVDATRDRLRVVREGALGTEVLREVVADLLGLGEEPTDQPDAGQPDAGRPDAGRPDAGQPDAGQPEAGRPDAGQPADDRSPPGAPEGPAR